MNDYSTCTVGIDLGDRKSVACVYVQGVVVEWFEFAMTPAAVRGEAGWRRGGMNPRGEAG